MTPRATAFAIASLAAGLVFAHAPPPAEAAHPADATWGELRRCLIGDAPLGAEAPSARVRRIALAAMGAPRGGDDAWPARCAPLARALGEGAERGAAQIAAWLAESLRGEITPDDEARIDRLFAAADAEHLDATGSAAPLPPPAATPLDLPAPIAGRVALSAVQTDRVPMRDLRLLMGDRLCTVDEARVGCAPAPEGAALLGTTEDGAAPLLFTPPAGEDGIARAGEAPLAAFTSYGALARRDGFVALLGWERGENRFLLRRLRPGREKSDYTFFNLAIHFENRIALLGDRIVTIEDGHLWAQRVQDGEGVVFPAVDLGALPRLYEQGEALRACAWRGGMAVLVRTSETDRVAILDGDAWSELRPLSGSGGAFSCDAGRVTVTRFDARIEAGALRGTLEEDACTAAGCAASRVSLEELFRGADGARPRGAADIEVAAMANETVLVWRSTAAGVRMRVAPLRELAAAPDRVLLDDRGALDEVRLFARPAFAVLLARAADGVRAIRVTPDGAATAMRP